LATTVKLEQAIARLDNLDRRDAFLSPEERELAELYTDLIEAYEERHYPVPHAPPHEFLRALLVERGLAQADIAHLLGGSGHTSETLNAKRSISKAQAKKRVVHLTAGPPERRLRPRLAALQRLTLPRGK